MFLFKFQMKKQSKLKDIIQQTINLKENHLMPTAWQALIIEMNCSSLPDLEAIGRGARRLDRDLARCRAQFCVARGGRLLAKRDCARSVGRSASQMLRLVCATATPRQRQKFPRKRKRAQN